MPGRKPPSDTLLARAAELRAQGNSWDATAKRLKRSARSLRSWPRLYAARWKAAMCDAQRRIIRDLTSELLYTLRLLLHADDGKLRCAASLILARIRHWQDQLEFAAGETKLSPLATQFAIILETFTDEQLAAVGHVLDRLPGGRAPEACEALPTSAA